jgi:hypothetical protein
MVYVIASLAIPTLACMVHAYVKGDRESLRGGVVFLGLVVLAGVLLLPVIGVD